MSIPMPGRAPEMDAAIGAADAAAAAVLEIYGREFESSEKDDGSPVTEADVESNRVIRGRLEGAGHAMLSEEDADDGSRLSADPVWVVDPLDGTSDFVGRTGEFTVMIALVRGGRPELGVVAQPVGGTLYAAQRGLGAFERSGNGWKRITVSGASEVSQCRIVGSRNHMAEDDKKFIESLGAAGFASVGSSLKVAWISSGRAEAYITSTDRMKEWDTAASCCILGEAGGRMTDMSGAELTYNNEDVFHRNGILATNGRIHDAIVSAWASR